MKEIDTEYFAMKLAKKYDGKHQVLAEGEARMFKTLRNNHIVAFIDAFAEKGAFCNLFST